MVVCSDWVRDEGEDECITGTGSGDGWSERSLSDVASGRACRGGAATVVIGENGGEALVVVVDIAGEAVKSSRGSTTRLPRMPSHRSSMRGSLKKSRPLYYRYRPLASEL